MTLPLYVLGALSIVGGFVRMPSNLGGFTLWRAFCRRRCLRRPPPQAASPAARGGDRRPAAVLAGIALAYMLWVTCRAATAAFAARPRPTWCSSWFAGWGFDRLYERVFVGP